MMKLEFASFCWLYINTDVPDAPLPRSTNDLLECPAYLDPAGVVTNAFKIRCQL